MLSAPQRDDFDRQGLLRLSAAIPAADVTTMRDRCWEFLAARHGIERDRVETWPTGPMRHLQALHRSGAFDPMASGPVRQALDELLGAGGWQPPKVWGLPLVTFPGGDGGWTVPSTAWHVDSSSPDHDLPGVSVFAFLTPVAATGGGTVVVPGSHRLVNRHIAATGSWRSAEMKAALAAEHPWLRELWRGGAEPGRVARYLTEGAVLDGTRLRVQELTGPPGEVILMHSRTLHAPAPNALTTPRMMLVQIIGRR